MFDVVNGVGNSEATEHFTFVFNVFVMMTFFNEINARKLHDEKNVFEGLANNGVFIGVLLATFALQVMLVQVGGIVFSCYPLRPSLWGISIAIGLTVFPVRYLNTFIPDTYFPAFGSKKQVSKESGTEVVEVKSTKVENSKGSPAKGTEDKRFLNAMNERKG